MAESETIADIIAEMHDEAARADMEQGYSLDDAAEMMREFASRVDAAAKRMERAHKKELETKDAVIQTEVAARESERDAHKREMKETVRLVSRVAEEMTLGTAKGVAPTMKDVDEWAVRLYDTIDITLLAPARNCDRFNSGDAAKLREALKLCLRGMCGYCRMDAEARGMTTECVNGCEALLMANAALAAPPRNCDLARDWMRDLYAHFKPPASIKREMPPEWVDAVMAFCRWLVAPATEKEGGANG